MPFLQIHQSTNS